MAKVYLPWCPCRECEVWYLGKLYPDLNGTSPPIYFLPQLGTHDTSNAPYHLESVCPIPGGGAIVSGWFSFGDNTAKPRYARVDTLGNIVWVIDKSVGHEKNAVIRVGDSGNEFVTGYTKWAGTDSGGSTSPSTWFSDWLANPPRLEYRSVATGALNNSVDLVGTAGGSRRMPPPGNSNGQGNYCWITDIQANGALDVVFCVMSWGPPVANIPLRDSHDGLGESGYVFKVPYGTTGNLNYPSSPDPYRIFMTNDESLDLRGGINPGQPGHPGDVRVMESGSWYRTEGPPIRFRQALSATFVDTENGTNDVAVMGRVMNWQRVTSMNSPTNGGWGESVIGVADASVFDWQFMTGMASGRFDPDTWGIGWGGKVLAWDKDPDKIAIRNKGFGSVSAIDYNWGNLSTDVSPGFWPLGSPPADDVSMLQLGFCLDGYDGIIRAADYFNIIAPGKIERINSTGQLWEDQWWHPDNPQANCKALNRDEYERLWAGGQATKPI